MPEDWTFVAPLPGISMNGAFDAGTTAIVPVTDERCQAGRLADELRVKRYLSRFRNVGRRATESALMIRRLDAAGIRPTDMTFLRNAFAASAILLARARRCRRHMTEAPNFSDAFDLPPVWLRGGPGTTVETAAVLGNGAGLPDEDFCGHPSPTYPYGNVEVREWDKPLADALVSVFRSSHRGRGRLFRRHVARILEVTYTAMHAPAHNLRSGNDWGLSLALWVSAYETIANVQSEVGFQDVRRAIERVPWPRLLRRRLTSYEYRSPTHRGRPLVGRMTRPVQVYARLYRARNMVLHGEQYERGRLEPGRRHRTWGPLHFECSVVFRCALLHFLAANGHGVYASRPTGAEARTMGIGEIAGRFAQITMAHGHYYDALGSGTARR